MRPPQTSRKRCMHPESACNSFPADRRRLQKFLEKYHHRVRSDCCVCCKRYALIHQEYSMLLLHVALESPAPPRTMSMRTNARASCAPRRVC